MRRFTLQKAITYEVELVAEDLDTAIELAEMEWPDGWEVVFETEPDLITSEDDAEDE